MDSQESIEYLAAKAVLLKSSSFFEEQMIIRNTLIRESILSLIMLVFFSLLQGCAAAYYSYGIDDQSTIKPVEKLPALRISYSQDWEMVSVIERTLRSHFGVFDAKEIPHNDFRNIPGRFALRAKLTSDASITAYIWGSISILSFATIPAVINEEITVTYELIAPNGDIKTSQYSFPGRSYNWLPLIFFSPDMVYFIMNGGEDNSKLVVALEQINIRYFIEATPFIVTHMKGFEEVSSR